MSQQKEKICGNLISNSYGDRFLYDINRKTFDQLDAATLFQQRFGEDLLMANTLYIVVGTDSGLLPQHILKQGPGENSLYLFIELDQVSERLVSENILPQLPGNIEIISVNILKDRIKDSRITDYFFAEKIKLYESFASRDANLPQYRTLFSETETLLKGRDLQLGISINTRLFYEKLLDNITENRTPAMLLSGLFQGKTAVILGGGPSLDSLLPWVRDNQDKLVVLAVSRISRRLIEFGLTPHVVLSVDPKDVSFSISREMLLLPEDVLFIHANHVANRLCAFWKGRNLYLGPRYPWKTDVKQSNIDQWEPTVTNAALGVTVTMGFSQVILVGVDFCYSSTGMTHAGGSNESDAGPKLDDSIEIETNDGSRAETSPGYFHAMGYLAEQATQAKRQGCQVISPARSAARIESVDFIPTEQICHTSSAEEPSKLIRAILPSDTPETRAADGRTVLAELGRTRTNLRKIARLATEALEYSRRLYKRTDGKPDQFMQQRISKIEARLESDFLDLASVVKNFNMRAFINTSPSGNATPQEKEQRLLDYFTAYKQGAEEFCILLESAIKQTEIRLEEDAEKPDFDKIFGHWISSKQLWRILVLRHKRKEFETLLPNKWKEQVTNWEDVAMKWIRERLDDTRKKPVSPRDLSRVKGKALSLFEKRDTGALERLYTGLTQHPNAENAAQLQALIKGYHCELNENRDEALDCYQRLIDKEFTPLTEEALRRVSVISLRSNNLEMAQLALECLSNASINYKPKYADLLASLGKRQQAADIYTAYLKCVPNDIPVMLKLAENYQHMGAEDIAQQVFEIVLRLDPNNSTARFLLSKGRETP